ncbi:MAG: efflux RND transporter periplasmic adaptor subunit [Acutalibacteraceae bacterium]
MSKDIYAGVEKVKSQEKEKRIKKKRFRNFIKKHKVLSVIIAVLLVILIIFSAVFIKNSLSGSEQSYAYIRTTTLSKGSLKDSISATGSVESANTSNVTTSLNYTVKTIAVAVGDEVKEGDIILTLDTTELEKQIEKEKNNISKSRSSAQSSYDSAKKSYDSAKEKLSSYEDTLKNAKIDLNNAKTPYNTAKTAIASVKKSYETALKNYNNAGAAFVSAQSKYNKALSNNNSVVNAAKAYMSAIQNLYGNCLVGNYDISDSKSSISSDNSANSNSGNNSGNNIANAASSSSSVVVSKTANDICNEVIEKVRALTGETLSIPSGSNTLYKLSQKAASLQSAKAASNYDNLESAYNSAKSAYENAEQTYAQYQSSVDQAKSQLDQASEQLSNASTSDTLEELESQLDECYIKANQDGTIVALNATVGSSVSGSGASGMTQSSSSALATISQLDKLKVSITISEADINNAKIGMNCYITSDATDDTLNGTLSQIDPVAGETGSFGAEVTVDDSSTGLLIGMNASVEIIVSSTEDVFSVPIDAVGNDDSKGDFVYRKTGGEGTDMTFEKVYITKGEENDYYVEISSDNLAEGDVIRSSSDLSEGIETGESKNNSSDTSGFGFGMFGGSNMPNNKAYRGSGGSGSSGGSGNGNMPSPPNGGQ